MSSLLPYLCLYGSVDSVGQSPLLSVLILMLRMFQIWWLGAPSGWPLCFFLDISCHSLSTLLLLFWRGHQNSFLWHKMVQLNLDSLSPRPGLNYFTKEPGVILGPKIWKLGVLIATTVSGSWLPFQWTDGEIAVSYPSCLSPFCICSSFLSLWEQWVPRGLVFHSSAQF